MTSPGTALEYVVQAGQRIRMSADGWNSVSLPALAGCEATLAESASGLRDAIASLGLSGIDGETARLLREQVFQLKRNVTRLERLAGTSAAFLRGAPDSAQDASEYRPGGELRFAPQHESAGIQA